MVLDRTHKISSVWWYTLHDNNGVKFFRRFVVCSSFTVSTLNLDRLTEVSGTKISRLICQRTINNLFGYKGLIEDFFYCKIRSPNIRLHL